MKFRPVFGAFVASVLSVSGEARAEWVMTGTGREIAAFPMVETFDSEAYVPELVWVDDAVATFAHQASGGYGGSGAPQFNFVPNNGEDNTGLAFISFPPSASGVRHVSVRWLMFYGPGYFGGTGGKTLIVKRCNDGCSDDGPSAQRGMVMEGPPAGAWDPYISENIEASGDEPIEPGKVPFDAASRPGEWISYEAEFDLDAGIARLFVDTLDGEQDSAGGTAPYKVWSEWDTSNGFRSLDWLTGYWEAQPNAGPDSYYRIDELVIDTQYIGPPPDFRGGSSTTSSSTSATSTSAGAGGGSAGGGSFGGADGNGGAPSASDGGSTSGPADNDDGTSTGGCEASGGSNSPTGLVAAALMFLMLRRRRSCRSSP